ncbi:MAG: hypothetical protein AB7L92_04260 [Alphaproteobacteria bacterium]
MATFTGSPPTPYRFEWSVILMGAVLSIAISIVMLQFGSIIGLAADAPLRGEGSLAAWGIIASGLWLLWTQLLASLAGGYTAGRLRTANSALAEHENELRDGLCGLLVWAVGSVAVFIAVSFAGAFATYVSLLADTYRPLDNMTDTEKNTAIIFAFIVGSTSLMSAAAAWWAATCGGDHRDKGTDLSTHLSFRRK